MKDALEERHYFVIHFRAFWRTHGGKSFTCFSPFCSGHLYLITPPTVHVSLTGSAITLTCAVKTCVTCFHFEDLPDSAGKLRTLLIERNVITHTHAYEMLLPSTL